MKAQAQAQADRHGGAQTATVLLRPWAAAAAATSGLPAPACYLYAGYAFFNTHPVGSTNPYASPICYARTSVPTPAPTRIGDTISPSAVPTMEGAVRLDCAVASSVLPV